MVYVIFYSWKDSGLYPLGEFHSKSNALRVARKEWNQRMSRTYPYKDMHIFDRSTGHIVWGRPKEKYDYVKNLHYEGWVR